MRAAAAALAVALAGCGGADPGAGLDQPIRVPGAQLVEAPLPPPGAGPAITFVDQRTAAVFPGEAGVPLEGRVAGAARTVLVAAGPDAHWIVPVGLEDPVVAGELDFALRFDAGRGLAGDALTVELAAAGGGAVGPHRTVEFALDAALEGELVVELAWDRDLDLDLYVVDPDGIEIGPKDPNSYDPPPPGQPPDPPDAWQDGGILDADSNAGCRIDGLRRERVVWRRPPPAGRYRVLVDVAAPCGVAAAAFTVAARRSGEAIGAAAGVVYGEDARANRASGGRALHVLELDVR